MMNKLGTLAGRMYRSNRWLRWRRADAESSNITKLVYVMFGVVIAALFVIAIGALMIFGINKAQTSGANAMNSVSSTSGTTTVGGYTGSYTGGGSISLPSLGSGN
ncbi:hypothetical protein [Alicyclobacillus macrosporangiidus]|uniref:hypothetical protein n=1 Tax=Alicyclobacillus macrosporangiidus TaxID=392015 RepID=UPI00049782CF|nr:hypothetical protein [Alicyclobacillus macrosporangiidus]